MTDNIQIFDNATVRVDAEDLVCITDIYKIAVERGMAEGKLEPKFYFRKSNPRKSGTSGNISESGGEGLQFVEYLAENLNTHKTGIYKTKRGKGGGTYASKDIALAYALYLGGPSVMAMLSKKIQDFDEVLSALNAFHVDEEIVNALRESNPNAKMFVYAIKEADTGNVKIGISTNPYRRLQQLQTGNSSRLELVAMKEAVNGYEDEQAAHLANKQYHIHNEWFTAPATI